MPSLHIRDIDDAILSALKKRAARSHRSVQGEVRALLEAAARDDGSTTRARRLVLHTVSVGGDATFSRTEIYGDE